MCVNLTINHGSGGGDEKLRRLRFRTFYLALNDSLSSSQLHHHHKAAKASGFNPWASLFWEEKDEAGNVPGTGIMGPKISKPLKEIQVLIFEFTLGTSGPQHTYLKNLLYILDK